MRPRIVPEEEILFVAKTGFLSRKIWTKHFSARSKNRNYEIWHEWVDRKYFKKHDSPFLKDILILGTEGLRIIENKGIQRVFPPNINQIEHDEIVSDIALQLQNSENVLRYETEGELKRKFYGWVKNSWKGQEFKFSDLLILMRGREKTLKVAVEIELSRKNPKRYKQMMQSYQNQKQVNCIVFVARDNAVFDSLRNAIKQTLFPTNEKPIGFSKLEDWLKNPITAPIHFPKEKVTFENIPRIFEK